MRLLPAAGSLGTRKPIFPVACDVVIGFTLMPASAPGSAERLRRAMKLEDAWFNHAALNELSRPPSDISAAYSTFRPVIWLTWVAARVVS
ncbi:hypothetical protein [Mesorhizobium sp. B2-7-2]|uniref:hypothetical protein n=1 Tax=Mesorhizobium sp. B2-7-2 TaxID=2589908 RepID=UPI0011274607|nr:hypothetical protein [Mesorhizobium sp. B2-7-2]TPJ30258.1 hypothetical protein FJ425_05980 [Mesorhizobium sp. B2-7-2]